MRQFIIVMIAVWSMIIILAAATIYNIRKIEPAATGIQDRFTIMHVPASGRCPVGYDFQKDFFSERDGSKEPACVDPHASPNYGSVDMLKPGEGYGVSIPIHLPETPRKRI